jgi:hypothetical protein
MNSTKYVPGFCLGADFFAGLLKIGMVHQKMLSIV